jgi:hypothetical protein
MISEEELRSKRVYVGILAIGFLIAGLVVFAAHPDREGVQGALLRVGVLLGAFWLALPTKTRPAAWSKVSPLTIGIAVAVAAFLPRLRYVLPLVAAVAAIAWYTRPRRK